MIAKMIQNLENKMEAQINRLEAQIEKMQEMFNKYLEKLKNRQSAMNNTITEIKKSYSEPTAEITEAEEQISELEDTMLEITETKQNKEKLILIYVKDNILPYFLKVSLFLLFIFTFFSASLCLSLSCQVDFSEELPV